MMICKNCGTINELNTTQCSSCSMKGMLVETENTITTKRDTIKPIYDTCLNCGTNESGNGDNCQKCNFPLPKASRRKVTSTIKTAKTNIL